MLRCSCLGLLQQNLDLRIEFTHHCHGQISFVDDSGFSDAPSVIAASFEHFIHLPANNMQPIHDAGDEHNLR
jgi:hypothetical protein